MTDDVNQRLNLATSLAREAGEMGLAYFRSIGELVIEQKGAQDLVSNADRDVERFIRERLAEAFPDDGVVGEEYDDVSSGSGYTWVIDPIDGTANFVRGIPSWCVAIACVCGEETVLGIVYEPCNGELFSCSRGRGAFLNGTPTRVARTEGVHDGTTGVGMNGRTPHHRITRFIGLLGERGGIFYRNASGALMLAYVASGRLIGYAEPHMNAWDCLAGQLLVAEAGGLIEEQSAVEMLERGGRVVVGAPLVHETLVAMADEAFTD